MSARERLQATAREGGSVDVAGAVIDHLDLWTGAVTQKATRGRGSNGKVELTGVKKLRELILELAVRGKLVEQIAGDVPAHQLIDAISDLKRQKIREGALPKPKIFKLDTEHVPEYDVPNLWTLTPLGYLTLQITDGVHHTPKYLPSGVPFISVKDIDGRSVSFRDCKYISEEQHNEINKRCNPERGDILLCRIGTLGRATIVDTDTPFSLFVSVGLLKMPTTLISSRYVHLALHSPFSLQQMDQIKAGGSHTNKLNLGAIPTLHIPVPPMEEQHRIVQKVDELMALCDRLEQQTSDQLEAHETLVDTLLGTLTQSENATELADNWARLAAHFDTLFTTEQSIDKLKQTILQLAVMGRLVEQDAGDEPASILLNRIEEDKNRLAAEGKIKKNKRPPEIREDETPFNIPRSWQWARIHQVSEFITSGSRDWAKYYSDSGAIFITMGNLSRGNYRLRLKNIKHVSPPTGSEGARTSLRAGDMVVSITGDVGNLGLIPEGFGEAYINQHSCLVRFSSLCRNRYFAEFLRSPFAKTQFNEPQRGIKNSFRLSDMGEMTVPLPPLQEQHRIVQKVDELMALCDQLKERLHQANETRCQLAEAIVEKSLRLEH
ncbi:restriction endonuclease subunit S [Marinobacter sp. SBS5]|uniref:restriction endonuclease subunit S n=1 Tax=Marinobacter sp. SBS5 TaxID=3401754 RepID=UPI003AAF1A8E